VNWFPTRNKSRSLIVSELRLPAFYTSVHFTHSRFLHIYSLSAPVLPSASHYCKLHPPNTSTTYVPLPPPSSPSPLRLTTIPQLLSLSLPLHQFKIREPPIDRRPARRRRWCRPRPHGGAGDRRQRRRRRRRQRRRVRVPPLHGGGRRLGRVLLPAATGPGARRVEEEEVWTVDVVAELIGGEAERSHSPRADYPGRLRSGRPADLAARADSVAWILKVRELYGMLPVTAYLAVSYMDRFLSLHRLPGNGWAMQLLAVTCLSLAAKMEETLVPSILDLQAI
ncbi:Os08g0421100, partial [Oryza sativa Japonica Group]